MLFALPVCAEELVVVVHPDNPLQQVDMEELAELYLGKRQGLADMKSLAPLDLRSTELRERFYRQVAQRNLAQLRAYWSKRVFTGKGRPPRAFDTEALVARLRAERDAIGYLPRSAAVGLKPVRVLSE